MSDEKQEEEDVDSGWDVGAAGANREPLSPSELEAAVGLALDNLEDLETTVAVDPQDNTDLAQTVEAPALTREALQELLTGPPPSSGAPTVRGGADLTTRLAASGVLEQEPPTRRAEDEELAEARHRAPTSPQIKLAGRRATPILASAAADAKKADAHFQSRPTPRATAVATTALRFPAGSLVDARNRRKTTKINLSTLDIAKAEAEAAAAAAPRRRAPSAPLVDLHLDLDEPLDDAPVMVPTRPPPPPAPASSKLQAPPTVGGAERSPDKMSRAATSGPVSGPTSRTEPALPAARRAALKLPEAPPSSPLGLKTPSPPRPARPARPIIPRESTPPLSEAPVSVSPLADTFDGDGEVRVALEQAELSEDEEAALGFEDEGASPKPPSAVKRPIAVLDDFGESVPAPEPPSRAETARAPEDPQLTPIRIRFERGDYLGALLRAEALLEERPDFEHARRYFESAQELLRQMYLEKLGGGEQVLRVAMDPGEIQGLTLDHRAGFLISLIDGVATVDEILDISGMAPLDALRLLFEMRQQGVVAVDSLARP